MNTPHIGIISCQNYEENNVRIQLDQLLTSIHGLDFVRPGMKIAIKANLVTASDPDLAVVTHPSVLKVLCDLLIERGAQVVIGDSPGGPFTEQRMKRIYQLSGMDSLVRPGVTLNMNVEHTETSFHEGKVMRQVSYTSWLAEADAIICVCKLKSHGMMTLSANIKNMFGAIPGTTKLEYHYRFPDHMEFAHMLVDINEFLKPVLYITDGIIGMEGNGPTSGTPRYIGALLAGHKPYLLDDICARIIGVDPAQVPVLRAARVRDLYDPKEADSIIGDYRPFIQKDFRIPETRNIEFGGKIPQPLVPVVRRILQSKPMVKNRECIGCGKCYQVCPAHAITMKNNIPVIKREKCIRCFCCQEFCPRGAMVVHRPMIARLLAKI